MQNFDVLVVGGGPAGASCAGALRQHGLNVLLIDRAVFPRDKVCAGWITPAVVDALGLDLAAYGRTHVLQPFQGFRTGLIGGAQLENRYPSPVSYGIRRVEFDHHLLLRAGVKMQLGVTVRTVEQRQQQWVINNAYAAPMLVGAGGNFCPIARLLDGRTGVAPVVAAQEIEFLMSPWQARDCAVRADTPELFFCHDLKGYGWCLRKGEHLNIGLGRESCSQLPSRLNDFCTWLQAQGSIPERLPRGFHGHAYRLWGSGPQNRTGDGMLLIGDAAGLARPQSGEGILPAVQSGLLAARVIAQAAGDYRQQNLADYPRQLQSAYGKAAEPRPLPGVQGLRAGLGRALLGSRWFSRHVLLDRWFLHPGQIRPAG